MGGDAAVDLALAVDGADRLYVPGTSLAGALRDECRRICRAMDEPSLVKQTWGDVPEGVSDAGLSSGVLVGDAVVTSRPDRDWPLSADHVEVRTGNGIDRGVGTVATTFLYTRAILPRGAYLAFELDLESEYDSLDDDPAQRMIAGLLHALKAGRVRLGAGRTRGLGRAELVDDATLTIEQQDLTCLDGLLEAVGLGPAAQRSRQLASLPGELYPDRQLRVVIEWKQLSPVMVRASVDGLAVDALPLTSPDLCSKNRVAGGGTNAGSGAHPDSGADDPLRTFVLPGSSLKGALRSCAERIVRTAYGPAAAAPMSNEHDSVVVRSATFRNQLDQHDVVRVLFGSAGRVKADDGDEWGRGALAVDDCYARTSVPSATWRELMGDNPSRSGTAAATDQGGALEEKPENPEEEGEEKVGEAARDALRARLPELDQLYRLAKADHVAIDRWTGGAADGRLYSVLEPYLVEWEPIRLHVDLERLGCHSDELRDAALALLLLVLRELDDGRVRFGHGVNRGHGDVKVISIDLYDFPELPGKATLAGLLEPHPLVVELARRWRAHVNARAAELEAAAAGASA